MIYQWSHVFDGWEELTDDQRNILFLVLQDHAHRLETILPQNAVRVAAGDHDYQVYVEYLEGCYLYEIDSKTGSSLIQLKNT